MTPPPFDLHRLLAEEPFVRALAQRLVAADADDVVQQTFVRAMEHGPDGVRDPRRWLTRIVQNLVHDLRRRSRRRAAREDGSAKAPLVPSSRELLEGEEVRRALVAAVDALPEALRTVVLLRFYEGLPPRAIGARLGVPAATVSHRLHAAIVQLRERLDRGHGGDRRAWFLPMVPFATRPRTLPFRQVHAGASATTALGVLTMSTKQILAVFVPLALAVLWFAWPGDDAPNSGRATEPSGGMPAVANTTPDAKSEGPAGAAVAPREDATPAVPVTGSLLVHVLWGKEPRPLAGQTVRIVPRLGIDAYDRRSATTDAAGTAHFTGLPPDRYKVRVMPCPSHGCFADVRAGEATECTPDLTHAITVTGIVVDPQGTPVAGAGIEVAFRMSPCEAETIGRSSADGTFTVRPADSYCLVGARAPGFGASQVYSCHAESGGTQELRIVLQPDGGAVTGRVVDGDGRPVADAIVRIGDGSTTDIRSTNLGAPPMPAQVRTDQNGAFGTLGLTQGDMPIHVSHPAFAPYVDRCEVAAHSTVDLRVVLRPGLACEGTVRDKDGAVVAKARIQAGERSDLWRQETFTAPDGTFRLRGLPAAGCDVQAGDDDIGKATVRVEGAPGSTCRVEVTLRLGNRWTGRVLDQAGKAVANASLQIRAEGEGPGWDRWQNTDAEGRFAVSDPPAGRTLSVAILADGHDTWMGSGITPVEGWTAKLWVTTVVPARVQGRLLRPDGTAASGVEVDLSRMWPRQGKGAKVAADGAFATDLPPGDWHLRIRVPGHPEIRREPRALQSGETWDLGTLQLTVGGTLVLQKPDDTKVNCLIFDPEGAFVAGLYSPTPPLRSGLLAPGDYVLSVQSEGLAAQAMPFAIRSGEETTLRLPETPGIRLDIVFEAPAGTRLQDIGFDILRGGRRLWFASARGGTPERREGTVWLAPGDYELRTDYREPMTTAQFTVGTSPGQPLRIRLR